MLWLISNSRQTLRSARWHSVG